MHAFLGGAIKTLGAIPEKIGGTDDHVHILMGLKATHCLADVMRDIKKLFDPENLMNPGKVVPMQ